MTTPLDGAAALRVTRTLAGALMGALVVIGIALLFVTNGAADKTGSTPTWIWVAIVVIAALGILAIQAVGYPPLPPERKSLSPAEVRQVYQSSMVLRFAFSESIAVASIAMLFVDESKNFLVYVLGAVIALALMAIHVWPGTQQLQRAENRMNRRGANVDLLGAYGLR